MTQIRVLVDGRLDTADDYASALATAASSDGVAWFDISLDDDAGVEKVAEALGWKNVVAEALRRSHKRARLEQSEGHTIVVLLPARYDDPTETVEIASLGVIAAERAVVTFRGAEWIDLSRVREFLAVHRGVAKSAEGVLWAICAAITDQYTPVLQGVEDDIDEIEEQMFELDADVSRRIFALQRELIRLEHATAPLPEMLDALAATQSGEDARILTPRFRTSSDAAESTHRKIQGFRQTLDNALTVHATLVGEQSNVEMKRMTEFSIKQNDQVKKISSWAAIGFAPSLVAGIYGMNFHLMPELTWTYGYPYAIALMVAVAGGLYWVFKRHDWL